MFWGLILEPFKRYSQTVKTAFHISNAAIDASTGDNEMCQVMVGSQGKDFLICTLQKGKILQTPLDLYFKEGSEISFTTTGKCVVHLTGYLDPEILDEDLDEEDESLEEEEEEDIPTLTPIDKKRKAEFSPVEQKSKKQKKEQNEKKKQKNKAKKESSDDDDDDDESEGELAKLLEEDESDENDESYIPNDTNEISMADSDDDDDDDDDEDDDDDDDEDDSDEEQKTLETSPAKTKKNKKADKGKPQQNGLPDKKNKKEQEQNKENELKQNQQKTQENFTKEKKVLPGNVAIEDLKVGQGNVAKPGKMLQVYYEGKLKSNNKMFDSCLKGPGFKFKLGKKEVISGWDVGLVGMKVGGKRRIVCPPGMAYGKKGSPPVIPPNSTLVFEVELKGVN